MTWNRNFRIVFAVLYISGVLEQTHSLDYQANTNRSNCPEKLHTLGYVCQLVFTNLKEHFFVSMHH